MDSTHVNLSAESGLVQPHALNVPATEMSHQAGASGNVTDRLTSSIHIETDPFLSRENSPSRHVSGRALSDASSNGRPPSQLQRPPQDNIPVSTASIHNLGRQDSRYGLVSGHHSLSAPIPAVHLADNRFDESPHRQPMADSDSNRRSAMHSFPKNSRENHAPTASAGYHTIDEKCTATIDSRIKTTIKNAEDERAKYAKRAMIASWALNIAIGLQVLLGSLTTGLSGLSLSNGKSVATLTTILGALSTLVASFLARARSSDEPNVSMARVKDLDQFLRESKNFRDDHGEHTGHDFDKELDYYRARFEKLLGNVNEQRPKSSAVEAGDAGKAKER